MSTEKPEDDLELLLYVAKDPVRFLGQKSFPYFQAFTLGYFGALPVGEGFRWLDAPSFEDFVREQFPTTQRWPDHLSAACYIHFLGGNDAGAFDLYVELRRAYFAAHPPTGTGSALGGESDFTQLLESVRQRPRMYFSKTPDLMGCLVAFLNGAIETERVHKGMPTTERMLDAFQTWMNRRYPWAREQRWDRILGFQNFWDPDRSLTGFWTHFDLFRNGEPPDAMTPTAKRLFNTNPGLDEMSEEQRKLDQRRLNRIFYTE